MCRHSATYFDDFILKVYATRLLYVTFNDIYHKEFCNFSNFSYFTYFLFSVADNDLNQ